MGAPAADRSAGAKTFFAAGAGNCGLTAVLAMIAAVFSRLAIAGSTVLSLTSVATGVAGEVASATGAATSFVAVLLVAAAGAGG